MMAWSVVFLTLATISAVFAFGAVDRSGLSAAETLFWFFLGLAAVVLVFGWLRPRIHQD